MIIGKERTIFTFRTVCLAAILTMYANHSVPAEVASALFPIIKFPVKPDNENGVVSSKFITLVQSLSRPCDKNESISWKSSAPSKDLIRLSDRIVEKLKSTYTVTNLLSTMKPVSGVEEMYGAFSSDGAIVTLIWSSTPSTVNVAVCGNLLATKLSRVKMPGGEATIPGKGPLDVKPPQLEK